MYQSGFQENSIVTPRHAVKYGDKVVEFENDDSDDPTNLVNDRSTHEEKSMLGILK